MNGTNEYQTPTIREVGTVSGFTNAGGTTTISDGAPPILFSGQTYIPTRPESNP